MRGPLRGSATAPWLRAACLLGFGLGRWSSAVLVHTTHVRVVGVVVLGDGFRPARVLEAPGGGWYHQTVLPMVFSSSGWWGPRVSWRSTPSGVVRPGGPALLATPAESLLSEGGVGALDHWPGDVGRDLQCCGVLGRLALGGLVRGIASTGLVGEPGYLASLRAVLAGSLDSCELSGEGCACSWLGSSTGLVCGGGVVADLGAGGRSDGARTPSIGEAVTGRSGASRRSGPMAGRCGRRTGTPGRRPGLRGRVRDRCRWPCGRRTGCWGRTCSRC